MPSLSGRPSPQSIAEIHETLLEKDLHPRARVRLRAVLAWAEGKTSREAAALSKTKISDGSVRAAIKIYLSQGIAPFLTDMAVGRRTRTPASISKQESAIAMLKAGIAANSPLSYRYIAEQTGLSLGSVAGIAKRHGLSPTANSPQFVAGITVSSPGHP